MTAAQRAMATAMIYPEPEKGGRGTSRRASSALKVWSPSAGTALIRPEGRKHWMKTADRRNGLLVNFAVRICHLRHLTSRMIGLSFLVPWVSFRLNPQG